MKILIACSSRTGNTRRLAEGIAAELSGFEVELANSAQLETIPEAGAYLVGYWADRGHADEVSEALLRRLSGKRVGLFGTLGAYPYGKHARQIAAAAEEAIPSDCALIGSFLCQGPVDPALLEQFKSLPAGHPHAPSAAASERHAVAARHPNSLDAQYAAALFRERLEELEQAEKG